MHRKALQTAIAPAGLVIDKIELSGGELESFSVDLNRFVIPARLKT